MEDERGRPRRDPGRRFGPSAGRGPRRRPPAPPPGAPAKLRRGDLREMPPPPATRASAAAPRGSATAARACRGARPPATPPAPPGAAPPPSGATRPPKGPAARTARPRRRPPRRTAPVNPAPPPKRPAAPAAPPGADRDADARPGARPTSRVPAAAASARPGVASRPGAAGGATAAAAPRAIVALGAVSPSSGTAWAALSGSFATSGALAKKGTAADGATDILLVGTDSRNDAQGNPLPRDVLAQLDAGSADGELNTDSMILVRVPNDGSRAVAFSLPRDSYVKLPGQFGKGKLNSVYPGAKAAEAQRLVSERRQRPADVDVNSSEAGRQALIEAVQDLTGIGVDHYAEVNLLGFYNLTNAIGGVDVCLKNPVDDDFSGRPLRRGPPLGAGHDALAFVRQRHGLPLGDLDRVRRQQAFLAGLSHKVLSAGTLADPVTLDAACSTR